MTGMSYPVLDDKLARDVLQYLGVEAAPPSLSALDALVAAYVRRVPWESASRIARRARIEATASCPRWPETFWQETMARGTGGTCYESNYAFFSLLRYLGYEGYLTVNDMNESIGCHSAIVVRFPGESRYLVDAGLPVHIPLPLDSTARTARDSGFHTYSATPDGAGNFLIERDRHPRPYCFTLIDKPVGDANYRAITTADYGDNGLFLDRVIAVRVIGDRIWRFNAEGAPYHLVTFHNGAKTYHYVGDTPQAAVPRIAEKFGIDPDVVSAALNQCP